jgi:hypothetical protein
MLSTSPRRCARAAGTEPPLACASVSSSSCLSCFGGAGGGAGCCQHSSSEATVPTTGRGGVWAFLVRPGVGPRSCCPSHDPRRCGGHSVCPRLLFGLSCSFVCVDCRRPAVQGHPPTNYRDRPHAIHEDSASSLQERLPRGHHCHEEGHRINVQRVLLLLLLVPRGAAAER